MTIGKPPAGEALDLRPFQDYLGRILPFRLTGTVVESIGLLVESKGPAAGVGDFCEVRTAEGKRIRMQVVGFREGKVLALPLEDTGGLQMGDQVVALGGASRVAVSAGLLGRILDGFGEPMDGEPAPAAEAFYDLYSPGPGPLDRTHIAEQLITGIRSIDALLACGKGQRVGLFGGSGVGKSTLLGSMARNCRADVCVIALVGERNREVRGFIDHELGPEGLARSVVVAATSDRPAPLRTRACFVALAIAEYFRDLGKDVLLVMDSVTLLAMAQREIGLAAGEPPSQKGYTPSVFHLLPKVFERAGSFPRGSITGVYTVLVEGDDFNEPISDAVRAILDGHIILSRDLGAAGHYPAIDVLQSVSRVAPNVTAAAQQEAAQKIREAMATYRRSEDLINLGAYAGGSNPRLDAAIRLRDPLLDFLRQRPEAAATGEETLRRLGELAAMTA